MAKYPLHKSVEMLYRKIAVAVRMFEQAELSLQDVLHSQVRMVGEEFHDIPAAFKELERQGKLGILEGDRFRVTEQFGLPIQQVTAMLPASMAAILARHRVDATAMAEAYVEQYVVENGLRDLVGRALIGKTNDWWQLVPSQIQGNAKARFDRGLKKPRYSTPKTWDGLTAEQKLTYTTFPELRAIVADRWSDFKSLLPAEWSEKSFIGKLEDLDPLRDDIGHVRPLAPEDRARLNVQARDIANGLERAGG